MKTYTIAEAIHHIYTVAIEQHNDFRGEINGRAVECVASGSVLHLEYWITVNGHAAPAAPTPAADTTAPALPLLLPTLDPIVYTPESFAAMIAA